uniref:PARP alpha-helical domain-containing protein n=1 Tax=Oryza brachyantha TaxID=4533 RepID=J3KTZ8_ORYBR
MQPRVKCQVLPELKPRFSQSLALQIAAAWFFMWRLKIPIRQEGYLGECIRKYRVLPFDLYKVETALESSKGGTTTVKVKGRSVVHESSGLQETCHILEDGKSIYNTTLNISYLTRGLLCWNLKLMSEMPLDKVSKEDVHKGFEALTDIQNLLSNTDNRELALRESLIVAASNRFFTLIPSIHPHIIGDEDDLMVKSLELEEVFLVDRDGEFNKYSRYKNNLHNKMMFMAWFKVDKFYWDS